MARFVQTINGEVVGRYDLLPEFWDDHNLPLLTREQLKALGWYHVVVEEPLGWDGTIYKLVGPEFTIREDDVFEKYTLVPKTPEEIEQDQAAQSTENVIELVISEEQLQSNPEVADLVNRLQTLL